MEGTAARLLMLTSIAWVHLLTGANSSRYTAARTPRGKEISSVTSMVKNDPTAAPQMPASSGSRLSPAVKKVVLKTVLTMPRPCRRLNHSIWRSFTRRSDSGVLALMAPLLNWSMSSDMGTRKVRRCPISEGSANTASRTMNTAPGLIMSNKSRLARRSVTSGNRSKNASRIGARKSARAKSSRFAVRLGSMSCG